MEPPADKKAKTGLATVMVVGSGGREMAQAVTLAKSDKVGRVVVCPGNGGTASSHPKIRNAAIKDTALDELVAFAKAEGVSLVAVGPEAPLVIGIADAMAAAGIPCFGPTKAAAQLENSKAWMKEFFKRHGLPTARYQTFTDFDTAKAHVEAIAYPVVVKASGLAGGKGVLIPTSKEETVAALKTVMVDKAFGAAGDECVVEEMLEGPECSVLAFCDGKTAVVMPGAQDHKRALDGDQGPNTGGMGAYAPCPCLTPELAAATADIVQRTVTALAEEGTPYVGVLFGGFMLTATGPQLLEYNVRMGDPETQVVLPLLRSDLYEVMLACCTRTETSGGLAGLAEPVQWSSDAAATVVMAAPGYPAAYNKGIPMRGLGTADALEGVTVFHAGTKRLADAAAAAAEGGGGGGGGGGAVAAAAAGSSRWMGEGGFVTSGGRVLAVTGVGADLGAAVERAYAGVKQITFGCEGGAMFRTDIAAKASATAASSS